MRKALLTSTILSLALLTAGVADAQSVAGAVGLNGSVAARCQFTTDNAVLNIGEMSVTTGSGSSLGTFNHTTLDGKSAVLNGWCNGTGATMTVQAFPMLNTGFTGSPPSGFDDRVDFTATAVENAASASASSLNATPGTPSTVGVFNSNITVSFSNSATPGGGKMIAGPYTGTVNVTLAPAT
jgi:hypothetical protein